jgi:hypothetical protein
VLAGTASRESIRESHRLAEFGILMRYHCAAAILNLFPNIGEQLDFNDQNYLQSLPSHLAGQKIILGKSPKIRLTSGLTD